MPFFVFELDFAERPLGVRVDGRIITLGRAKASDLVLPDPSVEPHHATLRKRGKAYLLTNEASEEGTSFLAPSGEKVLLDESAPRVIADGEKVLLGSIGVRIHLEEPKADIEWIEASDLSRTLVARSLAHYGHPAEKKDIDAALRELLGVRISKASKQTRKPKVETEPPPRETTSVLLFVLLGALVLSALALYWLLLPDTPRSL